MPHSGRQRISMGNRARAGRGRGNGIPAAVHRSTAAGQYAADMLSRERKKGGRDLTRATQKEAATKIQKIVRARQKKKKRAAAATKIQKVTRGMQHRKAAKMLKEFKQIMRQPAGKAAMGKMWQDYYDDREEIDGP